MNLSLTINSIFNDSETGLIAEGIDWRAHELGPPNSWSSSLKVAVSLMLNSQFPMFISWGPSRTFLYNDAYAPILGEKHPKAFGRRFFENWSEIWDDLLPLIERVDQGEAVYLEDLKLMMHRHRLDKLEETYFTFSYSPIRDEGGTPLGLFCAAVETTEKVLRRRQLEDSESKLAFSLESARMGIWSFDFATSKVTHSKASRKVLGFDRDYESPNEAIDTFIHPNDKQRVADVFTSACRSRQPYADEYRIVRPNGDVRWVKARADLRFDERGTATEMIGTLLDVTDEKTAQLQLAESEQRARSSEQLASVERDNLLRILETSPSPNVLWRTKDLIYERVSPSYQALFPRKVLIGKPIHEALPEQEYEHFFEILRGVFETGNAVTMTEQVVPFDIDGTGMKDRYYTLSFFQIKNADGTPYGVYQNAEDNTEQVLARKAIEFEQLKLKTVIENSTASIAVLRGANFVYEITNKSYAELFSNRELIGKPLIEALPELVDQAFPKHAKSVFETGLPYVEVEARALLKRTSAGPVEERFFDQTYSRILDRDGKPYGIFMHAQEVTERVHARLQLEAAKLEAERARDNLNNFFMQAPLPMVILEGPDHLYTLANEPYETFVGRKVVGKTVAEAFSGGEADLFIPILNQVYTTGESYIGKEMPVDLPDENGVMRAHRIDIGYHPFRLSDGSIKGILVLVQDVTEQVVARTKVEEGEANLRAAINSSAGGFYGVDRDGVTTVCNSAFLTMLGFERMEDAVGKKLHDVIHHTHPDGTHYSKLDCPIYQAASSGKPAHIVNELFFRLDGSGFPVEYWTAPIVREGEVFGAVTTFIDISDRKAAEEALFEAKENAERLRAEAEKANELKSAFLANMSHEIRTPLGAMLGFADLLKDPGLSAGERANYVNILTRNGEQLSLIINDILDLSKVEAGHLTLEYADTHHKLIGSDVVSLLHVKAREKDLSLEYSFDELTPETITSDSTRVRQILLNLAGNAIKFTQFGSVKIRTYGCHIGAKPALCFEVSDTGIGISKEQQARLFQSFSQADETTTRKFGGTGLGLALSRRLARELGGDITIVKSEVGVGTTFLVKIADQPEKRSAPEDRFKSEVRTEPELGENELAGVKILVVDDAPDNQQLIWRYLTKQGASVQSAENGLIGYRTALSGDFDLVLMDIQMPVMDGYSATQKLRDAGFTKPIVALTAHAMNDIRKKALNVGYTDHLTKPIKPKELIATIAKLVRGQRRN